jgi:outer membrane lipoprotein-sorting protein
MTFIARTALFALAVGVATAAHAGDPKALELMKKSEAQHRIAGERTRVSMSLQEKGGPERVRQLEITLLQDLKKAHGDKQLIRFEAPGDIKDTQLLALEQDDGSAEQFLFLPAFKKTRRIGTTELSEPFVGTDFSYEDLKRRVVEDYGYTFKGSETVDGQDCHKIEAVPEAPRAKAESGYQKVELLMRKDNLIIIRARFTDKAGKPWKELRAENIVKVQGDAWRADKVTMTDLKKGHRTVLFIRNREVVAAIPADTFNPHNLRVGR